MPPQVGDEAPETGADVDLKLAGQEVKLKNVKNLNTLVCVLILVILCAAIPAGYSMFTAHAADTKDAGRELTAALKDMAQAVREGNCINSHPEAIRESKLESCKRQSR